VEEGTATEHSRRLVTFCKQHAVHRIGVTTGGEGMQLPPIARRGASAGR
jgi:hypothetical protein